MWLAIATLFIGALLGALVMALCAVRRIEELERLISPALLDRINQLERWLDQAIDERDAARRWSRRWHALARARDRQLRNVCQHAQKMADLVRDYPPETGEAVDLALSH